MIFRLIHIQAPQVRQAFLLTNAHRIHRYNFKNNFKQTVHSVVAVCFTCEQLERNAEPVESLRDMDPLLSSIINRCLDKHPENRPAATEIFHMCETYIQENKN